MMDFDKFFSPEVKEEILRLYLEEGYGSGAIALKLKLAGHRVSAFIRFKGVMRTKAEGHRLLNLRLENEAKKK